MTNSKTRISSVRHGSLEYIPSIGIECHVQLNTQTKLFAAVANDARGAAPNTLISHICLGMPGALPVLNEKAVEYAMRIAFAFNTAPQPFSYFERKHYFYPDLPKGYQITQLQAPIVKGGYVSLNLKTGSRRVHINRVQLEEDAGKNIHPAGKDYSLVDLNRAGTPLLEIVSEPDIHSAEEARVYARELYLLVRYAGVSDADLYHGNMRFDVNVSVSNNPNALGTRTETKNLNSFKSVAGAVEYEIKRQIEQLEKGEKIAQETRGWDEAKQKTVSQRGKEEAHDYRYFPDPDLPPVELEQKEIEEVRKNMPMLPSEWREKLKSLQLDSSQIETLIDAEVEDEGVSRLPLIADNLQDRELARALVNWFVNLEIPIVREKKAGVVFDKSRLTMYKTVYSMVKAKKLSSTNAKLLLTTTLTHGIVPDNVEKYAEEQGFIQVTDEAEIAKIVDQVLADNPKAAEDVKAGELKAIGFLVGQVMKDSLGKANPNLAQTLIKKQLGL